MAIWQALEQFRTMSSIRTYVYRIGHNRGLSYRAQEKRRSHASLERDLIPDPRQAFYELTEEDRRRQQLQLAIRRLNPSLRQPLMLHLDGLSNPEIAEVVGITEGNVAVRLTRARKAVEQSIRGGEAS